MVTKPLKYTPLGAYLAREKRDAFSLSFERIEALVGELPPSARLTTFWANTEDHHSTRKQSWLGNGFLAFLGSDQDRVFFKRKGAKEADGETGHSAWSKAELRACVLAYHQLQTATAAGQKNNKRATRSLVLATALKARSDGAYEYRMQNISAVLEELGLPWIEGYKPARNIGGAKATMVSLINEIWGRLAAIEKPTADSDEFTTRALSARQIFEKTNTPPPAGLRTPRRIKASSHQFIRDPNVAGWVLNEAAGHCEACGTKAPFLRTGGDPFLEVHHVLQLAHGGPDRIDNTVGLCPNCHRRLHLSEDRATFRRALFKAVPRLKRYRSKSLDKFEAVDRWTD